MLREAGMLTEGNLYDIFNVSRGAPRAAEPARPHAVRPRRRLHRARQDKVVIIDEFTGRMMEGRRYSDGLHQALEAKEARHRAGGEPDARLDHLPELFPAVSRSSAGMTGTAMTEADEFAEIYKLDVVEIPTNVPCIRNDEDDEVYRTADEKYEAVAKLIEEARKRGQPVLVGTTSDREERDRSASC